MSIETSISVLQPAALVAVELWDDGSAWTATPPAKAWRAIRVEPLVWWLSGPLEALGDMLALIETLVGEAGEVADLSGGFSRIAIRGDWRERLMFGGVFDAEDPAFTVGSTAGTILHHVAVRYDVVEPDEIHVYAPPSYVADLMHHLGG